MKNKSTQQKTNLTTIKAQLITDLAKYTDFNKARAFESLVESLQTLLEDYQESDSEVAEIVTLVSARLLSRSWDLLIDFGDKEQND
jgi:hypothetical protein